MSIGYIVDGKEYRMSYPDLKNNYIMFCDMSDDEFIHSIPMALHLACVICYLKEIPSIVCLADTGIIHELTHWIALPKPGITLHDLRKLFEEQLRLA
jgi:hypothetical protein